MADATLLSVMSKQIEDNKQATDDLKDQMADLRKRKSHIEAMLSKLVSPSSGQTSRASGLNASPMMTPLLPEPPDPPDSNQFGQRLSKLEFPVFDGTLLDCWIAKVDRIFELEQYGNEEKLDFISLSLEGAALKWFRKHRREFTDWTYMKRKLMARFGLVKGCSPPEVLPKEKFITKVDQDTDFGSEKESTNSVEITSIKGHEVQGTTASHVRQFDVTTIADAVGIAKCCESSLLQHSSATQSRAPFSPYQSYNDQPYYERKFGVCPEIEFDRGSDEIKDVKLQDKQPEEDVKTLVISENEQSLECVGDEHFDDEKPGEVIVEEIVDEPVESSAVRGVKSTINDVKFHLKHKWRSRVWPRLSGLEFCLLPAKLDLRDWPKEESKQHKKKSHQIETFEVLSSLEPSRRSHNEQLGVSEDFPFAIVRTHTSQSQSDLKCVTGNAHRMLDVMPLETKPLKDKRKKALQKTWWFKFKTSLERSKLDDKLSFMEESIEKDITELGAQQGFKIEVWSGFDLEAGIGFITYGWEFKKQINQGQICLNGLCNELDCAVEKKKLRNVEDDVKQDKNRLSGDVRAKIFMALEELHLLNGEGKRDARTLLMVYDAERLIQPDASPIFSDLLCVKNRIRVRLKMVLLQEFLWLILFTSKMFKSSNVHQNKNQTDQKLSSYWKLLLRLLHPLHINRWRSFYLLVIKPLFKGKEESVSFNVKVTNCSSYEKALELIKDRDSRKKKLCKNWWFKYKLNTWLSGAFHHTGFVKIIQTFSPMINETRWDKEIWVKLNPKSCKGGSLLEFLKRHEARFDMIKVPNNTKFVNYLKFLVKSYTLRIEDALNGCKFVKFTMEQAEKPLITILSYEWFHSPRPPELSCCKEDEESAGRIASLRTRMI